jgi:hypothetical protein
MRAELNALQSSDDECGSSRQGRKMIADTDQGIYMDINWSGRSTTNYNLFGTEIGYEIMNEAYRCCATQPIPA